MLYEHMLVERSPGGLLPLKFENLCMQLVPAAVSNADNICHLGSGPHCSTAAENVL